MKYLSPSFFANRPLSGISCCIPPFAPTTTSVGWELVVFSPCLWGFPARKISSFLVASLRFHYTSVGFLCWRGVLPFPPSFFFGGFRPCALCCSSFWIESPFSATFFFSQSVFAFAPLTKIFVFSFLLFSYPDDQETFSWHPRMNPPVLFVPWAPGQTSF